MAIKSILLAVADPKMGDDITQALGAEWEVASVTSEADATAQFEKRAFDALLVDFNLGSPDASTLLNQALEKHPNTVRFLLAHEADLALVAAKVEGTPSILPKPLDPASLKSRIEDGVKDDTSEPAESEKVESAKPSAESATAPPIYAEVLKAIESPGVTAEQVADIIAKDQGLTSEILSLTKSCYPGLARNISKPAEAVESLGLEAVKAAVMALQFLAEHSRLRPGYLSLDQLWQHSINVGQIARDLVLSETKDSALASQALIAGLLHDLGKVVLAKNFDDLYGRVHSLASKQPVAIWDIEKEMFGANHGEIGACLIGMWNMPLAIVDAAALHHEPPVEEAQQLTPMVAVHIANVLERELWLGAEDTMIAPIISSQLLNEMGLLQRLPVWRAAFANYRVLSQGAEAEPAEILTGTAAAPTRGTRTTNPLAGRRAATRTATSQEPQSDGDARSTEDSHHRTNRMYAGIAVVLLLLTIWFRTQPQSNRSELAYARTAVTHDAPPAASSLPSPEPIPAAPSQVEVPKSTTPKATPTVAVPEQSPAPPPPSTAPAPVVAAPVVAAPVTPASTEITKPAPAPAPEVSTTPTAPRTTATNIAAATAAPEKRTPVFRINGIIYVREQPAAIVNGQTVNIGDEVDGATVVAIGRTTVTLQIDGERKTYVLR